MTDEKTTPTPEKPAPEPTAFTGNEIEEREDDHRTDKNSPSYRMIETEFIENGKKVKVHLKQDLTDYDLIVVKVHDLRVKIAKGTATEADRKDLALLIK
ncbi:MAG: hypothetical protein V3U02_04460 [Calditrichia bacterium]